MCSKAVKEALEKVPFVGKIDVDLKNQQYKMQFKPDAAVNFDALSQAVTDAGFSVAALKVTTDVTKLTASKDKHLLVGGQYLHILNGANQQVSGKTTFTVVDKSFVSAKEFKKYSTATRMACVHTGKAATCCTKDNVPQQSRVYHVII
jgi:copper chaperone CopZ